MSTTILGGNMTEIGQTIKDMVDYGIDTWRLDAACIGMDINTFFEEAETTEQKVRAVATREQAKKVCASCPVSQQCLDFAINNDIRYGIYGGVTYRKRLIYKRNIGKLNLNKSHTKVK